MNLEWISYAYFTLITLWGILLIKVFVQIIAILLLQQKVIHPSHKLLSILSLGMTPHKQTDVVKGLKYRARISAVILFSFLAYLLIALLIFAGSVVPMIIIALIGGAALLYGIFV